MLREKDFMEKKYINLAIFVSFFAAGDILAQELYSSNSYRSQMNQLRTTVRNQPSSFKNNQMLQDRSLKARVPKRSKGFFYGSSGSMILAPLRSKSRHTHVL